MTIAATTPQDQQSIEQPTLFLAFELGVNTWKLACTTGAAQRPRERRVPARDIAAVREEITRTKQRFGVPEAARVVSCYEAGRDGFWLHRALVAQGVANVVVESSSLDRYRCTRTEVVDCAVAVLGNGSPPSRSSAQSHGAYLGAVTAHAQSVRLVWAAREGVGSQDEPILRWSCPPQGFPGA